MHWTYKLRFVWIRIEVNERSSSSRATNKSLFNIKIQSLCPISYKDQIFQQLEVRLECFETCYWFHYPHTHHLLYNSVFVVFEWYMGLIMFVSLIPSNQVCVCFNLTIRVHCIELTNWGLCGSELRLMKDPLVLELTTKPIQYKDSIFMPYLIYKSTLSTSRSEIRVFWDLLLLLLSTNTTFALWNIFFFWMIWGFYYVCESNSLKSSVCVYFYLTIRVRCIELANWDLCGSELRLMKDPLVLEQPTKAYSI